jgi:Ran GTPase-activating protein (RanGAP) involved in mRNA processing and transport
MLLFGNNNIIKLKLRGNPIGPEGTIGLGQGLFSGNNTRLQNLVLANCSLGNDGLSNLLLPVGDGMINNTLTCLDLARNNIEGDKGGGKLLTLLLQRLPALRVLGLSDNNLGPLGARALAWPGSSPNESFGGAGP